MTCRNALLAALVLLLSAVQPRDSAFAQQGQGTLYQMTAPPQSLTLRSDLARPTVPAYPLGAARRFLAPTAPSSRSDVPFIRRPVGVSLLAKGVPLAVGSLAAALSPPGSVTYYAGLGGAGAGMVFGPSVGLLYADDVSTSEIEANIGWTVVRAGGVGMITYGIAADFETDSFFDLVVKDVLVRGGVGGRRRQHRVPGRVERVGPPAAVSPCAVAAPPAGCRPQAGVTYIPHGGTGVAVRVPL